MQLEATNKNAKRKGLWVVCACKGINETLLGFDLRGDCKVVAICACIFNAPLKFLHSTKV